MTLSKNGILRTIAALVVALVLVAFGMSNSKTYKRPVYSENWSMPTAQPDHVILTFSGDPATTQSVTWRTDASIGSAVAEIAIASDSPRLWERAKQVRAKTEKMDARGVRNAERLASYHSATFVDLIPDTTYAYRVGDGEHWSEWFHFRTASDSPAPFSFIYLGDAQNNILESWSRLVRSSYSKAPDARFIIHAGDLVSDAHSEEQWHEWFTAAGWINGMVPSLPISGNHEYAGYTKADEKQGNDRLSIQWRPQFTLPVNGPKGMEETVYSLEYQGVKIIAMNSNEKRGEQAEWLRGELKDNASKWTIATFHHPIFSASQGRDNAELRNMWKPLLDEYGVDLVLQGHDHSYVRHSTPASVPTTKGGAKKREQATGTVYAVSVSGGKMYNLKGNWNEYGLERDRVAENTQLFQVIKVSGDTLTYEAFTAMGELYDAFDLVKQKDGPNIMIDKSRRGIHKRRHYNTVPHDNKLVGTTAVKY